MRYAITLSNGGRVEVPRFEFGPEEDLLIWRSPDAPWPFVIARSEWLALSAASNVINAAASGGKRRMKRNRVDSELARYLADKQDTPGPMFGRALLSKDHYAAGHDGGVYVYQGGVYVPAASHVKRKVQERAKNKWTRAIQNEVLAWLHSAANELDDEPNPDVINVKNGLLRWTGEGWELTRHDPELRTTKQLPVAYWPKATCRLYDRFIKSSQPDLRVRKLLDEWAGYNLTSDCGQEKALINIGASGAGKSVYLHVLESMLGSGNVSSKTLQSLVNNRFASADLYGKLASICADLSATELKATGTFKELVSGDLISAEKKMKDSFQFHNVAKLSFNANEIPGSPDGTAAFFDRWLVVSWPKKFRDTKADDKQLKEKLTGNPREMSGVLNRALAGLIRLRQAAQFTDCSALHTAKDQFRVGADNVAGYLLDVATEKARRQDKRAWYSDYKAWCEGNGRNAYGSHRFYERIRTWTPAHSITVKATKSKGYEFFTVARSGGS